MNNVLMIGGPKETTSEAAQGFYPGFALAPLLKMES